MTKQDGQVIGMTTVVDHGPTNLLLNIVVIAEGFREQELPEFAQHVRRFADYLFTFPPFNDFRCGINIFRIDVASNESGADDPVESGGTGVSRATYFDASFGAFGIRRGISVDEGSVIDVVEQFVLGWHAIIVLVNSTIRGGMGGTVAKSSVAPGWENIMIHEMGHSLFGLADEYEYLQGCGQDGSGYNEFPSFLGIRIEPAQPNVTIWTVRSGLKWRGLVAAATPIPTTSNANCAVCDPVANPLPPGTVGTFEGAANYHCKVYRPEFNCMMRVAGSLFCAVCSRRIQTTLVPYHQLGVSWIPLRFARIHQYALQTGFVSGYPNFNEADYGAGVVFGSILLRQGTADSRDVASADLGSPISTDYPALFRAINDYAGANGYIGGYPNFHQPDYGLGGIYGCTLILSGSADWRDVPAAELGNPADLPGRFRAVHDYAVANGYAGGYPNFHQADYGQGTVYGCILIKPTAAEWQDVPSRTLCRHDLRIRDAVFVAQAVPSTMISRVPQLIQVRMRNNGTATWTRGDAYRLGSQRPQDNTIWGISRVDVPSAVPPGATGVFQFTVIPPLVTANQNFDFQWRMLQEGVEWFGDFTPTASVRVKLGGTTTVPDVREMTEAKAGDALRAADLEPKSTGATGLVGAWVGSQSPKAGTIVDRGSTVTLQLRTGPIP